ncbi:MAG: hypothetical protein H6669_15680 [Ardenticatenaceae bacterium]|nr:hypothetical protein [Ardenticatenaceae bacterium]
MFRGWLAPEDEAATPTISLSLSLIQEQPAPPSERPFFADDAGILSVYRGRKGTVLLHFLDGAWITVPLNGLTVAQGVLVRQAMAHGRFEDITFTSLAPLLRRAGYFLVHAFAAAKDDQGILIVGPSGSGKTTTGLSLLLDGWKLLANDVLLLQVRTNGVYALPTPGAIGIRPPTLELLPQLRALVGNLSGNEQVDVTPALFDWVEWGEAVKVTAVYFPQIESRPQSLLGPLNRAVAYARLMAESVDQWDEVMLPAHMDILQKLSQQAAPYTLHLGLDAIQLPRLLAP